ncbi:F-box domain-containing protein [Psidium guajava]|nr:F-box domain-containing protein [Psidium guajava]
MPKEVSRCIPWLSRHRRGKKSVDTSDGERWDGFKTLPDDVVVNVLSRLDVNQLVRAKRVCRRWRALIATAYFTRVHLQRGSSGPIMHSILSERRAWRADDPPFLFIFNWGSPETQVKLPRSPLPITVYEFCELLGCCDGMLIFRAPTLYEINNPVTRERVALRQKGNICGFFLHSLSNKYRLLSYRETPTGFWYQAGGIGPATWKDVGTHPYRPKEQEAPSGAKGRLHWMVVGKEGASPPCSHSIMVFSTRESKLRFMPHPGDSCRSNEGHSYMRLVEMDGGVYAYAIRVKLMRVWVLEDHASWHWVKKCDIDLERGSNGHPASGSMTSYSNYEDVQLIDSRDGELLLFWPRRGFFAHDLQSGTSTRIVHSKFSASRLTSSDAYGGFLLLPVAFVPSLGREVGRHIRWREAGPIQTLPDDVVVEVLSRLDVHQLGHAKRACRRWRALIETAHFTRVHLQRASSGPIMYSMLSERQADDPPFLFLLNWSSLETTQRIRQAKLPRLPLQMTVYKFCDLQGCCDGLLIFRAPTLYEISNPVTQERISLRQEGSICGFFLHALSNKYRLLSYRETPIGFGYKVGGIGPAAWEDVGMYPYRPREQEAPSGEKGGLHWMVVGKEGMSPPCSHSIMVFSSRDSEIRFMPHPGDSCRSNGGHSDMHLVEMEGHVYAFAMRDKLMRVWVLEDHTSWHWVKKYEIDLERGLNRHPASRTVTSNSNYENVQLVDSRGGKLLLYWPQGRFLEYNLRSETIRIVKVNFHADSLQSRASRMMSRLVVANFKTSLVSLKDHQ